MIEIVDLKKLKVVQRLEGHTDWVRCLSMGYLKDEQGEGERRVDWDLIVVEEMILLSGSRDKTVRYWTLAKKMEDKIPVFIIEISNGLPLRVTHNKDWSYILVVCGKKWMVGLWLFVRFNSGFRFIHFIRENQCMKFQLQKGRH